MEGGGVLLGVGGGEGEGGDVAVGIGEGGEEGGGGMPRRRRVGEERRCRLRCRKRGRKGGKGKEEFDVRGWEEWKKGGGEEIEEEIEEERRESKCMICMHCGARKV